MPLLRLTFKFHLPPSPPFFPPFRRPCCYKNTFRKICYFSSKTPPIPTKQQKREFPFPSLSPSLRTNTATTKDAQGKISSAHSLRLAQNDHFAAIQSFLARLPPPLFLFSFLRRPIHPSMLILLLPGSSLLGGGGERGERMGGSPRPHFKDASAQLFLERKVF